MEKKAVSITKIGYPEDRYGNLDKRLQALHIRVNYETEPPRGDGLYSVIIKEKSFPFWIYGRDILLIGDNLILVEGVTPNTFSPIVSILIDLKNEKYASLKAWYSELCFTQHGIELSNSHIKVKKKILSHWEDVEWLSL